MPEQLDERKQALTPAEIADKIFKRRLRSWGGAVAGIGSLLAGFTFNKDAIIIHLCFTAFCFGLADLKTLVDTFKS
jgi:hypothetical protein